MNSSCPECDAPLKRAADSCKCGWRRPGITAAQPLGYRQCAWIADNEQCRLPGSISLTLGPGGAYYCRYHIRCDDPMYGAQIVEASRDFRPPTEAELQAERKAESDRWLAERGLDRKPGEGSKAWLERLRVYRRGLKAFKQFDEAA